MRFWCCMALVIGLASCSKSAWVKGGENLNPDPATGKATPVTIWIYQLRGDAVFRKAGVAMVGAARATLAEDFLSEREESIAPGKWIKLQLSGPELNSETRYIGVVANFLTAEGDDWKAIVSLDEVNQKLFFLNGSKITVSAR